MLKFSVVIAVLIVILSQSIAAQSDGAVYVSSISYSPDGNMIAVGRGTNSLCNQDELYTIELINTSSNTVSDELSGHGCRILSVDFNYDGTMIVSSDIGARLITWNLNNNSISSQIVQGAPSFVTWNPAANEILEQNEYGVVIEDTQFNRISSVKKSPNGEITTASWHSQANKIAFGDVTGSVLVWDIASDNIKQITGIHSNAITALDWSPVSQVIATGDEEGNVVVWNTTTGQTVAYLSNAARINDLEWSPNGRALAGAGEDGMIRIWNIQSPLNQSQPILSELTSRDYQAPVYAVAWSPDGTKIAYGGQGKGGQNGRVEISPLITPTHTPTATPPIFRRSERSVTSVS